MKYEVATFLLQAVVISLSGVMAPGPLAASTLATGVTRRHAGAWIAVGHGVIEFPLMVLIVVAVGMANVLSSAGFKIGVGLLGGLALVLMGAMMLQGLRARKRAESEAGKQTATAEEAFVPNAANQNSADSNVAVPSALGQGAGRPLVTGMALTAGNPYFLVWWATVGLALATQAIGLGVLAFVLFAVVHWLCDLVWLELLSQASHRGVKLLGHRGQKLVPAFCGAAMAFFGGLFLYDAIKNLLA